MAFYLRKMRVWRRIGTGTTNDSLSAIVLTHGFFRLACREGSVRTRYGRFTFDAAIGLQDRDLLRRSPGRQCRSGGIDQPLIPIGRNW